MTYSKSSFAANLRSERARRNLTQSEVAEKIGATVQTISNLENEITSPSIDSLVNLADMFGLTTDALLGNELTSQQSQC